VKPSQPDRPGYKIYYLDGGRRRYHGVLWSRANTVVWMCDHEHLMLGRYEDGATRCAMDQMAAIRARASA
jgi:hypothetical protein